LSLVANDFSCGLENPIKNCIPDTGYWILDTGYWILDTGYWILILILTWTPSYDCELQLQRCKF
jgi:hypothetical protein